MAISEEEEFEFRARLEKERGLTAQDNKTPLGGAAPLEAGALPPSLTLAPRLNNLSIPNPENFEVPGATPSAVNAPLDKPTFSMPSPELLKPRPNPTIKDIPVNAVKDVASIATGLPVMAGLLLKKNLTLPSDVVSSLLDIAQGKDIKETQLGQDMDAFIETEKETIKGVGREVAHPWESFKERPVSTVADFLTLLSGAGRMAKAAKAPTAGVSKKLMSATLGPSVENIETRLGRNAAIRGAEDASQIADDMPQRLTVLEGKLKEADKQAWKTLNTENDPIKGAIPKSEIVDTLKGVLSETRLTGGGAIGQAQKKALATINGLIQDIEGVGGSVRGKLTSQQGVKSGVAKKDFVSEARMREIIQSLRENINYADESAGVTNEALMGAAAKLDEVLKAKNPKYASQMGPVAMMTELLKKAKSDLGIRTETNKGLVRTDATVAKLKSLPTDRKDVSRSRIEELGKLTGRDIIQDVEDAATASAFEGGQTQGSRRVNLGALAGSGVGSGIGFMAGGGVGSTALGAILGQVLGAITGAHLDKEGGRIAGQIIDWYVRNKPEMLSEALNKFISTTGKAAPVSATRHISEPSGGFLPVMAQ